MRNAIHRAMTHLIFVPKAGTLRDGNLGKTRGDMWLWGPDQLVLWVFYGEKAMWQYFTLHVTTLETWPSQNCHKPDFHWQMTHRLEFANDIVHLHNIEQ